MYSQKWGKSLSTHFSFTTHSILVLATPMVQSTVTPLLQFTWPPVSRALNNACNMQCVTSIDNWEEGKHTHQSTHIALSKDVCKEHPNGIWDKSSKTHLEMKLLLWQAANGEKSGQAAQRRRDIR